MGKFRELAPILTTRGAFLKLKGKIYRACVQVYGSETWAMKVSRYEEFRKSREHNGEMDVWRDAQR
jgi:hypothetical protein